MSLRISGRGTFALAALAALVTGSVVFVAQSADLSNTADALRRSAQKVDDAYRTIAREQAAPLRGAALDEQERLQLEAVELLAGKQPPEDIREHVRAIVALQVSLRKFREMLADNADAADRSEYALLERETGEAGDVRTLLQEYNDLAKRWNGMVQGQLGSLHASLRGYETAELPLLRFDGQEEYQTVIEL